jgi:hypothetical protein
MLSRKQLSANQRAWQSTALPRSPPPGLLAAQIDNMLTVSVAGAYGLSVDQETNFWTNKQLRCFARHRPSSFDTTATQSAEPPLFSSRSVDSIDCVSTTHRIHRIASSKQTNSRRHCILLAPAAPIWRRDNRRANDSWSILIPTGADSFGSFRSTRLENPLKHRLDDVEGGIRDAQL